jgi:hypothetical protein
MRARAVFVERAPPGLRADLSARSGIGACRQARLTDMDGTSIEAVISHRAHPAAFHNG